jgi:hypothetical protein
MKKAPRIKFNAKKELHYKRISESLIKRFGSNNYRIENNIAYIDLNGRAETLVDINDLNKVLKYKWRLQKCYAHNNRIGFLHRYLLGLPTKKDKLVCDHINRNKLDNRNNNLRITTQSTNRINVDISKKNKSGFKGVIWHNKARKWMAYINLNYKRIYLGIFNEKEEAYEARQKAEQDYFFS